MWHYNRIHDRFCNSVRRKCSLGMFFITLQWLLWARRFVPYSRDFTAVRYLTQNNSGHQRCNLRMRNVYIAIRLNRTLKPQNFWIRKTATADLRPAYFHSVSITGHGLVLIRMIKAKFSGYDVVGTCRGNLPV